MTAIEWDVYRMLPGSDPPEYLATLYSAREKTFRVELDGCGSGQFALNHTSPECTETILAQGNLVRVRVPEISDDYVFGFFLETGDFTLISSDEAGGEMLHFGGRGALAYTEFARAWSASYITGGEDPIDGVWRAYLAGTGSKPGQILRRLLEEFQHVDRPQYPLPLLVVDFDYDVDSNAETWASTDATAEFSYQVGEDGLAVIQRLIPTGITLQMDADFALHAYNEFGRDLTATVRFDRGVNIATELRREQVADRVATHELVQGEADHYGVAILGSAAERVTKEAFLAAFGTSSSALAAIGRVDLAQRLHESDQVSFLIANRRTQVSVGDPVSVGDVIGPGAAEGYYLPGPAGTNGDFWVGDQVTLNTGLGEFDYDHVRALVRAITITRDDDNHELIVVPELETMPFECPDTLPETTFARLSATVTPSGSSMNSDELGYIFYHRAGVGVPEIPTPNFDHGSWHFPNYNVGGVDYGMAALTNQLRVCTIGDGTQTIPTVTKITPYGLVATLKHRVPGIGIVVDEVQTGTSGDTFVFEVDTGEGAYCAHWIDVSEGFPQHGSGNAAGFGGGATWTPAGP